MLQELVIEAKPDDIRMPPMECDEAGSVALRGEEHAVHVAAEHTLDNRVAFLIQVCSVQGRLLRTDAMLLLRPSDMEALAAGTRKLALVRA